MTSKIEIPLKAIRNLSTASLDLITPNRCSRCNANPAPYFESHPLKYQGGYLRTQIIRKVFHYSITFKLRLPLCENCYQHNFIEAPETITKDTGPLAVAARLRSAGILIGSLIACVGFILLMKVIPLPAVLASITYLWLYPIALAALILEITYILTSLKNRHLENMLKKGNYDIQLHRAIVFASTQYNRPTEEDTAVVVELINDGWATECAKINGWKSSALETQKEKDREK